MGEGLTRAARRLGIDPALIRNARKVNPEFNDAVNHAEAEAAEPVQGKLYEAAINGEPWAVKLWLERRAPERWSPAPQTINVNHGVGPEVGYLQELSARLEARRAMLGIGPGAETLDVEAEPED